MSFEKFQSKVNNIFRKYNCEIFFGKSDDGSFFAIASNGEETLKIVGNPISRSIGVLWGENFSHESILT